MPWISSASIPGGRPTPSSRPATIDSAATPSAAAIKNRRLLHTLIVTRRLLADPRRGNRRHGARHADRAQSAREGDGDDKRRDGDQRGDKKGAVHGLRDRVGQPGDLGGAK